MYPMSYSNPSSMAGNEDHGFGRGLAGLMSRYPHTGGGMHPMQGNTGIVPQTGGYDAPHALPQFGTGGGLPPQGIPMTGGGFAPPGMPQLHTGGGFNPIGGNPMPPSGMNLATGVPSLPYGSQLSSLARMGAMPPGAGHFSADPLGLFGSSASEVGHYADGRMPVYGDNLRFSANRAMHGAPDYGDMARRFGG